MEISLRFLILDGGMCCVNSSPSSRDSSVVYDAISHF